MTLYNDAPAPTGVQPTATRFHGWRIVWVGAAILVIGGSSTGLPRVLDIALRGVPAARTGGPVFGLVHALLTGFLPVLLLPLVGWVARLCTKAR